MPTAPMKVEVAVNHESPATVRTEFGAVVPIPTKPLFLTTNTLLLVDVERCRRSEVSSVPCTERYASDVVVPMLVFPLMVRLVTDVVARVEVPRTVKSEVAVVVARGEGP